MQLAKWREDEDEDNSTQEQGLERGCPLERNALFRVSTASVDNTDRQESCKCPEQPTDDLKEDVQSVSTRL